jgi:hypothetical protein
VPESRRQAQHARKPRQPESTLAAMNPASVCPGYAVWLLPLSYIFGNPLVFNDYRLKAVRIGTTESRIAAEAA